LAGEKAALFSSKMRGNRFAVAGQKQQQRAAKAAEWNLIMHRNFSFLKAGSAKNEKEFEKAKML
jgi:hypothetical protein